ncbi:hypothetical protein AMECASPLE_012173 [Ameca splendens]|uniref:Uncharacterized protein n=1 Tax=Ameca splendens TaxID=208324 RepID=A0ABV0Y0W9_9TELE
MQRDGKGILLTDLEAREKKDWIGQKKGVRNYWKVKEQRYFYCFQKKIDAVVSDSARVFKGKLRLKRRKLRLSSRHFFLSLKARCFLHQRNREEKLRPATNGDKDSGSFFIPPCKGFSFVCAYLTMKRKQL